MSMNTRPTDPEVFDEYVTLRGIAFHYRSWPSAREPVLLLLHGLCAHARIFDRLAPQLADRYRVIALDQRGHGETDWTADYGWEQWVEDIEELRRNLGLPRLTIFGHSSGGWFAYLYAALHPAVVEKLVVGEAAPPDETVPAKSRAPSRGDDLYATPSFSSREEALRRARATGTRATEAELVARVYQNLRERPDGRWAWRYDPRVLAARDSGELRPSPEREWQLAAQVTCPTLILRGTLSEFGSTAAARERVARLQALLSLCQVAEIADAGHGLWMDQPDATLAALGAFL